MSVPVAVDNKSNENKLTKEQFSKVLPKKCSNALTDEMLDNINNLFNDQQLRENFRDNLLSYTGVLQEGRYKLQSYIDAVRYVSHKLLGSGDTEAYAKTFPDRFQRLIDEGATNKTISSYANAYKKNVLVNKIFEQTLIPSYILNADLYQKAINVQASLMTDEDVSPKVRSEAANSLLSHLKMPETTKIELDVGVKKDKSIDELRATTMELVKQQKLMLESGAMQVKEVAESKLLIDNVTQEVID